MDKTLFIWSLINLSCTCIITTLMVMKTILYPLIREDALEEEYERHLKTSVPFLLIELVSSIVMVILNSLTLGPLILLALALIIWFTSIYYNSRIIQQLNTMENELIMRRANVLSCVTWFGRFVWVFIFILIK